MPEDHQVTQVEYKGEKPNPHGGVLHKFNVSLEDASGVTHERVYWQRKNANLGVGAVVYGHIEDGEYGPRFKTDQKPDGGGNFKAPSYQVEKATGAFAPHLTKDDYWGNKDKRDVESQARMGRAHAQEMAIRAFAAFFHREDTIWDVDALRGHLTRWTDHFHKDVQRFPLDADLGCGNSAPPATALSAEEVRLKQEADVGPPQEASPAQKRKLTTLFNQAGIAKEAQKAIVLWRCRSEKATKDGASQLITDLLEGATHDALIAEVRDAARTRDAVAIRAAKLIPSDTPLIEPEPEVVEPNGDVPF